jgi:acyl-CoA thioesterase
MDRQDQLSFARDVVGRDPLATFLGIEVEEVEVDRCVVSLEPQPHHLNAGDRVHGSTIYSLIDQATAVAANTGPNRSWIVEGKVNFLAGAAPDQKLIAVALPIDKRRRLSLWEVRVQSGDELVAVGQMMAYHLPSKT